ncbi:hypothetical protein NQ317_019925 [Molorchus minor]|uniref:Ubiquitin carboxyl-terminal hydrolase 47 n=1 Tax=Molorchus minor TaxID=1323400 RepID=A0ABQ9K692_9CUCU|nr:hypothetical protein NQ317_019925 [Molorchus minor]
MDNNEAEVDLRNYLLKEMVCLHEESPHSVTVRDTIHNSAKKRSEVLVTPSKSIESIFKEVSRDFEYNADEIELILQRRDGTTFVLNEYKGKTFQEAGVAWNPAEQLSIIISQLKNKTMSVYVQDVSEDDLLLGASASPTTGETPGSSCEGPSLLLNEEFDSYPSSSRSQLKPIIVETTNYVGLVNQAMTCYLNSLLQALYMTPEFRNALYNWEFDGQHETRSIPYQLQKLFLNLQTSSKSAVETTDLTTSFGWQGSDAWHQHDIQELCRVMFDALEQKFKDTKQANLINDLYEGKMLDYVKCLECGTEKSREDTFLDIPLPVRPFGSTVAYNSVEEALRAFVQPETLDGNNQYHCEKCNKKCDAHKGLKFTKFPYLLTLHLKRFDFDYNTMHRIKLNDKVVFPEKLNLNSFVPTHRLENDTVEEKEHVKCDDCSTTDSGSADDESCQGTDVSSTVNGQDDNCADSDEGTDKNNTRIDVSSGNNHHEEDAKGPYIYELFSIMIHSGSASGGHYYAYIKDFDKNLWFCFNDQSVTGLQRTTSGKLMAVVRREVTIRGAYSSSTNAYMLMYRQIDKQRNCGAITVEEFPPHIQKLLQDMRKKEEEDRINREKENDMIKINVYCHHPKTSTMQDVKISVYSEASLGEAAGYALQRFKLNNLVNPDDCRLVMYNSKQECIDCSFESDDLKFCDINKINTITIYTDWLLEIKQPEMEWTTYKAGGINMKVYPINLVLEEVEEPTMVRVDVDDTVKTLKKKLASILNMDPKTIQVVQEMYSNEPKHLNNDDAIVKFDPNCCDYKLYVCSTASEELDNFAYSTLRDIIENCGYIISLNVLLPETDVGTLESLSIPSLNLNQNLDKLELSGNDRGIHSPGLRASPQPVPGDAFGDQSNSEDSSLSDSDRTLVGEAPGECLGQVASSSNSPADQHMASPTDPCEDSYNYDVLGHPGEMIWDDEEDQDEAQYASYYHFKVTSVVHNSDANAADNSFVRCCRILADKRMTLDRFKKHLEVILRVPAEYFKIFKHYPSVENEWSCLTDTLRSVKDGERLIVRLGRVLRKDEIKCNVYHLKPDCMDMNNFLFEHIIAKNQSVKTVKREILIQAKKQHMLDIPYNKYDQTFDKDIIGTSNLDIFLQELSDIETLTSKDQLVLFVRQYCPSSMILRPFQEVIMETSTITELKKKISELSGIPVEHVNVAHVKTAFPCDMHILDIQNELVWNPNITNLEQWPVNADDGSVFFYKDSREIAKELTPEEQKELNQKENTRLGRLSIKFYSPGRERALKIYLDTSPCKSDENCID